MQTPEVAPQPRLRLTQARNVRGLSQLDVANELGTTHVNVSRWERGITKPGPYFRHRLCKLFEKSEQELDLLPTPDENGHDKFDEREQPGYTSTSEVIENGRAHPYQLPALSNALYDPAIPLPPAIPLVGRDAELTHIRQRLCAGGSVALTALNGLPGVGKTALSIALAHDQQIRRHFQDGVLWAGLGPSPNISSLLSRWGTLLGISATQMASLNSNDAWARALRSAIGSRYMLLVIDDAWKVEEALTFKIGGPNCAHLVTTRFPSIASHISIEGATMIHELDEEESMRLLRLLAPQVVNVEEKKAHDLIHAVGGLPLALTLMGNYLRKQAYSGQKRRINAALERLTDAEERLHINEPTVPVESHPSLTSETPLSLQSVIAVTDQQLNAQASATLYTLAVFPPKPNSFSEEAVLTVAACDLDTIDLLNDTGLLESSISGRYTVHQTIADYAHLHLTGEQSCTAYARLIDYATYFVEEHKKDYELLDLESSTILAAIEAAYQHGNQAKLVQIVCAFAPFLILRGLYVQAEQEVQRAHDTAKALEDNYSITTTLQYLGQIAQKQGNLEQAEAYLQEGLTLARQLGDQELICALLNDLGTVIWRQGEYTQAEAHLQEGLTLARQIEDYERICSLLKSLGLVAVSQGDYTQAEIYYEEGLAFARQIGDRERICNLLMNLGVAVGEQGHFAQAETICQEALALARQIGHREWMSALLLNLGSVANEQSHYSRAEGYYQEGLMLARQIGNREWTSILLLNLGETAVAQGNYTQVKGYLQESLALARQIGRPQIIANVLYMYGNLYLYQQQAEAAEAAFDEMLATIPQGDQYFKALAHYGLARVAARQGKFQEAQQLGEASVTALETIGHHKASEVRQWLDSIR